jgi:hypothetical protein
MSKASTAWLNSILGVDGFGKISRSKKAFNGAHQSESATDHARL